MVDRSEIIHTVELLVRALVAFPEDLKFSSTSGSVANISILTNSEDGRRVIGERGGTFRALQHFVSTTSDGMVDLFPIKTEPTEKTLPKFERNPNWPINEVKILLSRLFRQLLGDRFLRIDCEKTDAGHSMVVYSRCSPREIAGAIQKMTPLVKSIGMSNGVALSLDFKRESSPN